MTSRPGPESDPRGRSRPVPSPGAAEGAAAVLVLLSADWAGPSRPAPTVLRELARRWGHSMHTLLLDDPDEETLDRWSVEHLPTWLRFDPAPAPDGTAETSSSCTAQADGEASAADSAGMTATEGDPTGAALPEACSSTLYEDELRGLSAGGEQISLPGPWVLTHRRSGALPKHVVESEFGPGAG